MGRRETEQSRGPWEWVAPTSVFLLALILRLIYLHQIRASPLFDSPIMDASYHDEWARAISGGDWLGREVFFRAPLYPYFLGSIYRLFGPGYYVPRLLQSFMGAGSCVLVYLIARRLASRTVALISGLMASAYGLLIYFDAELLIVPLIVFLDLALVLTLLIAREKPSSWIWLGAGSLMGLSAIARPNILLVGPFLLFWIWFVLRGKSTARHILRAGLLFSIGALVFILPVTVRNYKVGEDLVLISSQGGINFYIGNNPHSDGMTAVAPGTRKTWWGGYEDAIRVAQLGEGRELELSEVSRYWWRKGVEFVKNEPGKWLKLLSKKFSLFWGGAELSNNKDIHFFGGYSPLFRVLVWRHKLAFPFGLLVPLALTGVFLSRGEWRKYLLLYGFVFFYMASVVAFFVCSRYRMPIVPFLSIFGAYALHKCWNRLRSHQYRAVLLSSLPFLALLLLANYDFYSLNSLNQSQAHFTVGEVYGRKGEYHKAMQAYQKALEIDPSIVEARINLGALYARCGRFGDAMTEYKQALAIDPASVELRNNMGNLYAKQGLFQQAEEEYQEAKRLAPYSPKPYFNLGNIYLEQGFYPQAVKQYEIALRLDPDYESASYYCGLAYSKLGLWEEALEKWENTLAINPTHQAARDQISRVKKLRIQP